MGWNGPEPRMTERQISRTLDRTCLHALQDAVELAEEAMSCVGPYFREKWHLDERLATLKEDIERIVRLFNNKVL